ncbi:NUDIX domain-containing protein [Streptomyces luteireticuli]|uniref:NUDIX hydrolase n=1 Tax=Streptomyces luteireticuli TaxID=173858 RepID=UPI00355684EE
MTDAEYAASRGVVRNGASVLFTDASGRVLVEEVDHRAARLLPGGAVEPGEAPSAAAGREVFEELGLRRSFSRVLAVDWAPPKRASEVRFPGEVVTCFDGGVLRDEDIAGFRLPGREVTAVRFVEPALLARRMGPRDARRALAALRARINRSGPSFLEDGVPTDPTVLDRLGVLRTPRKPQRWPWQAGPAPAGLRTAQAWGWLFAPDGRVLVLVGPDSGSACLPGGTPEPDDLGDPAAVLRREAFEEARVRIGAPVPLGYLYDGAGAAYDPPGPCARVRPAAVVTDVGPAAPDPATGLTYARLLATPEQAAELFDWGPDGRRQVGAVLDARRRLGLPHAAPQAVTELPCAPGRFG